MRKARTASDKMEPFVFHMSEDEYEMFDFDNVGFCIACGADRDCCEPDAQQYECDECGKNAVYGTPELLIMGRITID